MRPAESVLFASIIITALLAPYSMGWLADIIRSRFLGTPSGGHAKVIGSLDQCSPSYIAARVYYERATA